MATPAHDHASARIEQLAPELVELSHRVHAAAELGFAEKASVAAVAELLGAHGFRAEVGGYGLATALRASAGHGRPAVGVFAEYDALPDIGHGCGHNVICATAVGAFLGVAQALTAADGVAGSVVLFGTPAEENGSGKETMARAGAFDELDAVLMLHPTSGPTVADSRALGLRSVEVTYHGVAAHASGSPERGRNALDAVVAAYQGIAALRQHIDSRERVHGVITEGGQAANVVPMRARARFLLRSPDEVALAALSRRVHRILEGAALMTETRLEATWDQVPPCLPIRGNVALAERFTAHYADRGHPVTARGNIQGSTDLGNISLRVPAIHPSVNIAPPDVAMHTARFAEHASARPADAVVLDGAVALAGTALDYLTDAELRAAVLAEFEARGGYVDVPALMTPPLDTVPPPTPATTDAAGGS
ncbi:MAG TPA: amidohydrolase [Pseudonocardia sp.]|jgi:amidohydrolase|nr:amidohydrolase [Pseudonocardia sp.]